MIRTPRLTRRSALKTGAIATGVAGVGTRSGVAQDDESPSDDHCYYQVDSVAGNPIETLGVSDDDFYGRQNRLIQYAHADGDKVIERDTWINSLDAEVRRCVSADPIRVIDGTASVEFTVADGCERQFSLAVYPLPGGEFSFGGRQALAAATTETFGPGTHELTVEDVLGTVCPPSSTGYEQRAKLIADDATEFDNFGNSVAVSESGETVLIGTPSGGSAYVFGRANKTWTQRAKLIADDAEATAFFGNSVGVSGSGGRPSSVHPETRTLRVSIRGQRTCSPDRTERGRNRRNSLPPTRSRGTPSAVRSECPAPRYSKWAREGVEWL